MKNKKAESLVSFLLFLIFLSILFEGILLLIGYIYADEVECNLVWCSFKKTSQEIHQYCSMNDEEINCSNIIINKTEITNTIQDVISNLS